jgi:hypothetical protein
MNLDGFEEFSPPRANGPTVTIDDKGFAIPKRLLDRIGHPARVKLAFHRERRMIALIASSTEDENSYAVSHSNSGSVRVTVRSFIRQHALEQGRFPATIQSNAILIETQTERAGSMSPSTRPAVSVFARPSSDR